MTTPIILTQLVGEEMLLQTMRRLWNSKMTKVSDSFYSTNHSPLEIPTWMAECVAPRSVAMQLETHKHVQGFYFWMASARPDRDAKAAEEYSRDQAVAFFMKFTSRSIINISHDRLCSRAEKPTREFVELLKAHLNAMGDHASVMTALNMMPKCAYQNGICSEQHSCGRRLKYPNYLITHK